MLPWVELWQVAIKLGISPSEFWRLSIPEWRWLITKTSPDLSLAQLTTLMRAYPDTTQNYPQTREAECTKSR